MIQFNNEQYRAVMHRDGPMLVLAGPGTGKTAVIVGRTLHLIRDEHVDPGNILVLTFSRAAAIQMQSRFIKTANIPYPVTFGTFHAIFYHILKRQGMYRTGTILTGDKKSDILKKVSQRTGAAFHNDPGMVSHMIECISFKKTDNTRFIEKMTDEERSALDLVYDVYVEQCRKEGFIDFDDMINECLKALSKNDKILDKWRERYRYILVDEFQSANKKSSLFLRII
ncbi:MAG: ATP-dependent helicase [Lachnospiraceae bacterium]|nr:ATP-dependent helicase [Lachnospiraceae bacterium]